MIRALICGLVALCLCGQVRAQEQSQLYCRGMLFSTQAVVAGIRQYRPINALGDGHVQFRGTVSAGGNQGHMTYEGYTHASFKGVMANAQGTIPISVLDNTGGLMIIYTEQQIRMGPPDEIGRFVCDWR